MNFGSAPLGSMPMAAFNGQASAPTTLAVRPPPARVITLPASGGKK